VLLWCDPVQFMAECARVLRPGGVLTFSTFGPDTLIELRRAWAAVDDRVHVQPLVDMHDLGDLLVAAGFADPVVDVERLTVTYPAPQALFAELRAAGAANAWPTRRKTLMGRARWEGFLAALAGSVRDGRWPVSLELIFGHAWRRPESRPDPAGAEFAFPLERLARRSPSA
jgi:malonyl-CoA O-methyltransferase